MVTKLGNFGSMGNGEWVTPQSAPVPAVGVRHGSVACVTVIGMAASVRPFDRLMVAV
jgi:hypothetical protein